MSHFAIIKWLSLSNTQRNKQKNNLDLKKVKRHNAPALCLFLNKTI